MSNCVGRFFAPIFLLYIGFILLGGLIGIIVGLFIPTALTTAIIVGLFIGLALALIANAIIIVIINRTCYKNDYHPC